MRHNHKPLSSGAAICFTAMAGSSVCAHPNLSSVNALAKIPANPSFDRLETHSLLKEYGAGTEGATVIAAKNHKPPQLRDGPITDDLMNAVLPLAETYASSDDRLFVGERIAQRETTLDLPKDTGRTQPDQPLKEKQAPIFFESANDANAKVASEASEDPILFEADSVFRETTESPVIAEGNVRAYFGERYLKADRLTYSPDKDVVTATGNVSITDENLETIFADEVQLTGDLRDGVSSQFSAILAQSARVAADTAIQEQGARTRLRKVVYTACEVCDDEGNPKKPTWRLKSVKVVRDAERKIVRFYHSFFEIKGVPILYSPFLQGPDPTVERQSGFLTVRPGASGRLGFELEAPYYFAISNSQDATLAPRYTANDGVLYQAEYRRKDDRAYNVISGSVIDFDNFEDEDDVPSIRWHVFAKGERTFGDRFTAGYDVERASDDTHLRRYNIVRRGDLRKEVDTSGTNQLRSTVYSTYNDGQNIVSAETFAFQDLRAPSNSGISSTAPEFVTLDERDDLNPYVLPLINYHNRGWDVFGGRAFITGNFAALQRQTGLESRRVSASAAWEGEKITKGGHRFKAYAELRGDLFSYSDLDQGTFESRGLPIAGATPEDNSETFTRFAPTIGLDWSYPLTRSFGNTQVFLEPRVQFVASRANLNDNVLVNEDSRSIRFDYAGLFDINKSTGFDTIEDGQRMNIGFAASLENEDGITFGAEIGQQYRLQSTTAFATETAIADGILFPNGVGDETSDIVGRFNLQYQNFFGIDSRFRFSDGFGSLTEAESLAYLSFWRVRTNVSYVRLLDEVQSDGVTQREELTGALRFRMTKNWTAGAGLRQNLFTGENIFQDFSIGYSDDCSLFEVIFRRNNTSDRGLENNDTVLFRFTLKSLVEQ
ncbi:MAG: LPS assembly protein LptD [Pseudomonadota bacterium]